ncbi:MAG: PstS family phosphate ABC transporter substrate-binding protein [Mariprofundaceae bacterium]
MKKDKDMRKSFLLLAALIVLSLASNLAEARDQVRIVGSSTVYPFASYVSEEFGQTTRHKTPVIESTGSGGGMKLFCAGNGLDTPDITNASRRMKAKEIELCASNGVKEITEVVIGYDGIAIAQSSKNKAITLSRTELLLAVAAEVPNQDGTALIPNSYKFWDQIDSRLPHRKILFYGPPTSSGTRDAFEDLVMKHLTKHMDVYKKVTKKYHKIRQDGVYIPSGENDNLIVQKLIKDRSAFGIFGYSYLEENSDRISGALVDSVAASPETISSGAYPLSRSLYFYIKKSHEGKVKGISEYVALFMSDDMTGEDGSLSDIGLIPLPETLREEIHERVEKRVNLTLDDLHKK